MTRLEQIAPLFRYPDAEYAARAAASAAALKLDALVAFAGIVVAMPRPHLQECYVDAFDLDPACAPELGWHLFGERYERGEWLASLRRDLRRLAIDEAGELPDHVTNVLMLLARDEPSRAADLALLVAPAFDALHAALERRDSAFRYPVAAARQIVAAALVPVGQGDGHV